MLMYTYLHELAIRRDVLLWHHLSIYRITHFYYKIMLTSSVALWKMDFILKATRLSECYEFRPHIRRQTEWNVMVKGQECLHFSKVCYWHGTCTRSQTTEVSFVTLKNETSLTGLSSQYLRYCPWANRRTASDVSIATTNKITRGKKKKVLLLQ